MAQTQLVDSNAKFRGQFCAGVAFDAFHLSPHGTLTLTWSLLTWIYLKHILQHHIFTYPGFKVANSGFGEVV